MSLLKLLHPFPQLYRREEILLIWSWSCYVSFSDLSFTLLSYVRILGTPTCAIHQCPSLPMSHPTPTLSSLVPRPHPVCISLPVYYPLCVILKAICTGVGFGSGTETKLYHEWKSFNSVVLSGLWHLHAGYLNTLHWQELLYTDKNQANRQ